MCSVVAHIVFGLFLIAGIGLSLAALATPGWIRFKTSSGQEVNKGSTLEEVQRGFFECGNSGAGSSVIKGADDFRSCVKNTWEILKEWEKATFGCLIAGAALGAIALIWAFILCCCLCCCDCYSASTLPVLAFLAFAVDLAAVVVYGVYSSKDPPVLQQLTNLINGQEPSSTELGYSFWLGVGATAAYFIDIFVGACLCSTLARKNRLSMV